MVKENWCNTEPNTNTATVSGGPGSNGQTGVGSESKTAPSTHTNSKTPQSQTANPWGDYISKQNFIDMHFC